MADPISTAKVSAVAKGSAALETIAPSYGNNANALGAVKQQQQQQKAPRQLKLAQPYRPQPISLQQARQMFDPGKFYGMLRGAGLRG